MAAYLADLPIGSIIPSVITPQSLPDGWLPCDGSVIPPAYQQLKTVLGSNNTPNLIGRTLIGAGSLAKAQTSQTDKRDPRFVALSATGALQIGDTGGEGDHLLSTSELPSHSHQINNGDFGLHHRSFEGSDDSDLPFETNSDSTRLGGTNNAGGDQRHYNAQPYYAVTYMIYAGQS